MKLKYAIECLLLKTEMETFARNEFNFSWRFLIFSRCFCRFELVNFVRTCGEVEDEGGKQRRRPKFALILLITIYSVWLVIVVDITRALIVQFRGILPHCPRADYGSEKA